MRKYRTNRFCVPTRFRLSGRGRIFYENSNVGILQNASAKSEQLDFNKKIKREETRGFSRARLISSKFLEITQFLVGAEDLGRFRSSQKRKLGNLNQIYLLFYQNSESRERETEMNSTSEINIAEYSNLWGGLSPFARKTKGKYFLKLHNSVVLPSTCSFHLFYDF